MIIKIFATNRFNTQNSINSKFQPIVNYRIGSCLNSVERLCNISVFKIYSTCRSILNFKI